MLCDSRSDPSIICELSLDNENETYQQGYYYLTLIVSFKTKIVCVQKVIILGESA